MLWNIILIFWPCLMLLWIKSSEIQSSTRRADGVSWRWHLAIASAVPPVQQLALVRRINVLCLCCAVWSSFRSFGFSQGPVWELLAVTAAWQWWAAAFSLCPRRGHGDHTAVSWSRHFGGFSTCRGTRHFTQKMGLEIEGGRQEPLVWGWDLLGGSCPALLPCASQCTEEKCPFGRDNLTFLLTAFWLQNPISVPPCP